MPYKCPPAPGHGIDKLGCNAGFNVSWWHVPRLDDGNFGTTRRMMFIKLTMLHEKIVMIQMIHDRFICIVFLYGMFLPLLSQLRWHASKVEINQSGIVQMGSMHLSIGPAWSVASRSYVYIYIHLNNFVTLACICHHDWKILEICDVHK